MSRLSHYLINVRERSRCGLDIKKVMTFSNISNLFLTLTKVLLLPKPTRGNKKKNILHVCKRDPGIAILIRKTNQ